jgi:hypothetical protein
MMKKNMLSLAALAALLAAAPAPAQEAPDAGASVTARVDWARSSVQLDVAVPLDPATPSVQRAKGDAETDLEARLPEYMARALAGVTVDSSHTLGELMTADAALYAAVNGLAAGARRTELSLSRDMARLLARYLVPFYGDGGIALPLLHDRANPINRALDEVVTRAYTGLIVFASGQLPAAGTRKTASLRPALFPRIWDERMNLVLDRSRCAPESLARWGMAGYARSADDPAVFARTGALPLRCAARGVFGENATDLVIAESAARELLALPENIALLREGRISIVCDGL